MANDFGPEISPLVGELLGMIDLSPTEQPIDQPAHTDQVTFTLGLIDYLKIPAVDFTPLSRHEIINLKGRQAGGNGN